MAGVLVSPTIVVPGVIMLPGTAGPGGAGVCDVTTGAPLSFTIAPVTGGEAADAIDTGVTAEPYVTPRITWRGVTDLAIPVADKKMEWSGGIKEEKNVNNGE